MVAGGTPDHAALAATIIGILRPQLPRGCRSFTSDLRLRIPTGLATYPDIAVICGSVIRAKDDPMDVVNPVVLVEVTSDSTEDYDRGEKLRHDHQLQSAREILLVSHRQRSLVLHRRDDGHWLTIEARAHEILPLASVAAKLPVDDVYGDTDDVAGGDAATK
jgi:Uma2 family endonuclease